MFLQVLQLQVILPVFIHDEILPLPVILLVFSTIGLYGGGVVFNDVFDAELDKIERPERPIPSGLIKKAYAALFGIMLLIAGITSAALSGIVSVFLLPF